MVEFVLGRNIKTASDKFLMAAKADKIANMLAENEKSLKKAVLKQTPQDNIKSYDLGTHTVFVCLHKPSMSALDWQKSGGEAYRMLKKCTSVKVALLDAKPQNLYDFALGVELASYRFDKYFTKKQASFYPKLEQICFVGSGLRHLEGLKENTGLANAVRYARDLINEPANALTPQILADDIKRLEYLGLKVEILDETQMREANFNLALAVAQGSQNRPKVAVLQWHGNPQSDKIEIGLVGKGVTFDSGGISLKGATNMGDMKQDMAGAAAVVATMKSLALQKVGKNVVAVVGLVENMPSGTAYRPGDVVTSMSGQTVEVINTDAEGRLVLSDCLTYIQQTFAPEYVADMATLTGAITIALGNTFAGIFSNNKQLAKSLTAAGEACGERVWQMPLDKEFDKLIDSTIADMKNTGGRQAGSSTAACFLQRYVLPHTKWVHIDIAGMDGSDGSKALYPKGASGFGVRLLNQWIKSF